jgi:restriction system protein
VFDEDGSLDPVLKVILWLILGVAIAKVAWKWLTQDAWPWVRDDVGDWFTEEVWGWLMGHPWWFALIILGTLVLLCFVVFSDRGGYAAYGDALDDSPGESSDSKPGTAAPKVLTFRMKRSPP